MRDYTCENDENLNLNKEREWLTCSGRSKLRESFHQWESLTAVSTALVVVVVLVRTSIVRAVVLCKRSVGLIEPEADPETAAPVCYGKSRKVTHKP